MAGQIPAAAAGVVPRAASNLLVQVMGPLKEPMEEEVETGL
jgi:hypothetical protein